MREVGEGKVEPGVFYDEAVQWMVDNDITTGTAPTCFSPEDPVTRGQAAAFTWRMEGEPAPGVPHLFTDVVAGWQQDPVSWMLNNKATTGTSPTTFAPENTVTRGRLAAFFYRFKGSPAVILDFESPGCSAIFVGDRISLCAPPASYPANVPFHVNHGFGFDEVDAATFFATQDPRLDLTLDGVPLQPLESFSTDVSPGGRFTWVYPFPNGLTGSHTFVGEWYEQGVVDLRLEVEITFP